MVKYELSNDLTHFYFMPATSTPNSLSALKGLFCFPHTMLNLEYLESEFMHGLVLIIQSRMLLSCLGH
jgi:hypothetical protein